ncbi:hypothetical protein L798_05636 [Zootermopsis nevadensis]|uniref:Uncharacterized protein n=1 Tax=Zootermopsis nevadensis TaxID=136037 RepID=A0A067RKV4_ZOONE|nr:hypothetical protein L798_05636 [Zootermopsis nevadensis]
MHNAIKSYQVFKYTKEQIDDSGLYTTSPSSRLGDTVSDLKKHWNSTESKSKILGTKTFARTAKVWSQQTFTSYSFIIYLSTLPMEFSAYNHTAACVIPFLFYVRRGLRKQ